MEQEPEPDDFDETAEAEPDDVDETVVDEPDEPDETEDAEADAGDGDDAEDEQESAPTPKRLPARKVARWAAEQVMEMTGKESESVISVSRNSEGWNVGLEVVESHRIPSSTDVLAIYEAEMDPDGELVSYRRVKRYTRGRGDDE